MGGGGRERKKQSKFTDLYQIQKNVVMWRWIAYGLICLLRKCTDWKVRTKCSMLFGSKMEPQYFSYVSIQMSKLIMGRLVETWVLLYWIETLLTVIWVWKILFSVLSAEPMQSNLIMQRLVPGLFLRTRSGISNIFNMSAQLASHDSSTFILPVSHR